MTDAFLRQHSCRTCRRRRWAGTPFWTGPAIDGWRKTGDGVLTARRSAPRSRCSDRACSLHCLSTRISPIARDPACRITGNGAGSVRALPKSVVRARGIVPAEDYMTIPVVRATSSQCKVMASSVRTIGGGATSARYSRSREAPIWGVVPQVACTITLAVMTMCSLRKVTSPYRRKARIIGGGATSARYSPSAVELAPGIVPQVDSTTTPAVVTTFLITS